MSFSRELLYSISDQLGRPRTDMNDFITILEKNWYDNQQSLRSLSEKDFDKLGFPARLSKLILNKLQKYGNNQKTSNTNNQKMEIQTSINSCMIEVSRKVNKQDFKMIVDMLIRIFSNIRDNITQQKYRVLKKSNQKISKLTSIGQIQRVLLMGGFQPTSSGYVISKINLSLIDQTLYQIRKHQQKIAFNPYQQSITSLGSSNIKNYQGQSSVVYNDKLAQLQKQRQRMMSKPIKQRDVRVYQSKGEVIERMELEENQKEEMNQDERIYMQNVKEILKKAGEDPKFMNRRKKEYFDLLKAPCFTQTSVKVKLPDNWIFQCKFAPLESLQTLVDIFHQNLQNKNLNYYLYMTPPVKKLSGITLRQTFYDLGCVPRAIFHFKAEEQIKGNILKTKKSGFLSFFS